MLRGRQGSELPSPESGKFGGAVFSSYMWGFWFGIGLAAVSLLSVDLKEGGSGHFLDVLGLQSAGWAKFWACIFYVAMSFPVSGAAAEYYRFTHRTFVEDRIGFARAGGQDIGTLSGILALVITLTLFGTVVPETIGGWIRIPAILILSIVLGSWLSAKLARRTFEVLFGAPRRARFEVAS